jgi:hypothetical protein
MVADNGIALQIKIQQQEMTMAHVPNFKCGQSSNSSIPPVRSKVVTAPHIVTPALESSSLSDSNKQPKILATITQ